MLRETVAFEPGDLLTGNFNLVVDTLDGEEDLLEALCPHDIELPFRHQTSAVGGQGRGKGRSRGRGCWEERKEREKRERVGKITKGIGECWISGRIEKERGSARAREGARLKKAGMVSRRKAGQNFASATTASTGHAVPHATPCINRVSYIDPSEWAIGGWDSCSYQRNEPLLENVVQSVDRSPLLKPLGQTPLASTDGAAELLGERLVLSELREDGLVKEVLDVFLVVERGWRRRALVGSLRVGRDSWEDTLENAKSSEVRERALELFERLVSGNVVLGG